ncbi:hypothetical protein [Methylobacterium sp. JK268]
MTGDLNEGPLAPATTVAPPPKLTGRERRRLRRRRRIIGEEIVGWILVPLIVLAGYWAFTTTLAFFGQTPSSLFDQVLQVKDALQKKQQKP